MNYELLIVTPLHPCNKFNGASQRINKVISRLSVMGFTVSVFYTCQDINVDSSNKKQEIEENLSRNYESSFVVPSDIKIKNDGVINELDDYYPVDIVDEYLRVVKSLKPRIVLVNYVFLSKLLEVLPAGSVEKVIDTHDKLSRAHIYKSAGLDVGFFCTTEDQELKGLQRAHKVLCIQDNETKYFENNGIASVYTIGHLIEKKYINRKGFRIPRKIGFLGSNHVFNSKSIELFLEGEGFLRLTEYFEFVFAGGICDNELVKKAKVTRMGRVDSELDFYESIDIVINPVILGTGLKIKTIEALSYGVPIVGTNIAFDGVDSPSEYHKLEQVEDIYDALWRLLENPSDIVGLSNLSKNLFEVYYQNVVNSYQKAFGLSDIKKKSELVINHVVNFTEDRLDSDLYIAQPITMFSLEKAKRYAEQMGDFVNVKHQVVTVSGETVNVRYCKEFDRKTIDKTIRDIPGFDSFKPLPLLADVLQFLKDNDDDEYVVFTNADISLKPDFYTYVSAKIREGYDALVINRRTVSKLYSSTDEYDEIISDFGEAHPGFDCFVFKVAALKKMQLGRILIGVHLIGRVLLWNLFKYSDNPLIIKDRYLTFHIGDDNSGKDEKNHALLKHNYDEASGVLTDIYTKELANNIGAQAPDALKTFYKPNIYRKLSEKKRTIFIHSMFRTGSSYLWGKFSSHKDVFCYYEPFHETLQGLSSESVGKAAANTGGFHKRLGGKSYWLQYKGLIEGARGVVNYNKRFAYSNYCNNSELKGQFLYVENLIQNAELQEGRAVLQFNRTALRQSWFRRSFPDSLNFYLVREPKSQFKSFYDSYIGAGRKGFLRTQLAYIDHNLNSDFYKGIGQFISMPQLSLNRDAPMPEFFSKYDSEISKYGLRELFFIFLYDWFVSLVESLKCEATIINMSLSSSDLLYRRWVESTFVSEYIYLDLDDCSVPSEVSDCLKESEYNLIFNFLVSIFKENLLEFKENLAFHRLNYTLNEGSQKLDNDSFKAFLRYELSVEDAPLKDNAVSFLCMSDGRIRVDINYSLINGKSILYGVFSSESERALIDIEVDDKKMKVINKKGAPLLVLGEDNVKMIIKLDGESSLQKLYLV